MKKISAFISVNRICYFALFILLGGSITYSQTNFPGKQSLTPIEKLLNPDGSINTHSGFEGSLDPKGFRMVNGPKGEPRFVRASESKAMVDADSSWDDRFTFAGANSIVDMVGVNGTDLYIGGSFTIVHDVKVNHFAKWNGTSWSDLGNGFNGVPSAIAFSGTDVYVIGGFTLAGGVSANQVAKWDGSLWSALGSGISMGSGSPSVIAVAGTDVYVGGNFTAAGGVSVKNIARWNGTTWDSLGSGLAGGNFGLSVKAIAINGGDVYVGGMFVQAGGVSVHNIARWDGSAWDSLGAGVRDTNYNDPFAGYVTSIARSGTDIYVGGGFNMAGNIPIGYIAKWNGTSWSALGSGRNGEVSSIAINGSDVYVSGGGSGVAKWDGSTWSDLGVVGFVQSIKIAFGGGSLYAAGEFASVGVNASNNVAQWNGSTWSSIPAGLSGTVNNPVNGIATTGNNAYEVGKFYVAGGVYPNGVAKWDSTTWSSFNTQTFDNNIYTVGINGGTVYVGGDFTDVSGKFLGGIARWNGFDWTSMNGGISGGVFPGGVVRAIAFIGPDIYIGGNFTSVDGVSVHNIAKWNGSVWQDVGGGVTGSVDHTVYALAVAGTDLYVGGYFDHAGAVSANNIAKWSGSSWSALGSGATDNGVYALAVSGNTVYVGGGFSTIRGVSANRTAKWDGNAWSPLGSGLSTDGGDYVSTITTDGPSLYVGGHFSTAGGVNARNIARWNGASWVALGSGVDSTVNSLGIAGRSLYAGGFFQTAGGKASYNFGRWALPPPDYISGTVYNDAEGDSALTGNAGLDGWVIKLYQGGILQSQTVTSSGGHYSFFGLTAGTYTVEESLQVGWVQTVPRVGDAGVTTTTFGTNAGPRAYNVTIGGLVPDTGKNFGNFQYVIGGRKYRDVEGDSTVVGNTPLDDWVIKLYQGGILQSQTVTSGGGRYSFFGLTAGTYTVEESLQVGWIQTVPRVGDAGVTTTTFGTNAGPRAYSITVGPIHPDTGKNFGNFQKPFSFVVSNRWNMVSVPIYVSNDSANVLFPTAISLAYQYSGGYAAQSTLGNGKGYWLKFNSSQTATMKGSPISLDSIHVTAGWNMIGSISSPVAESSITSAPPGMITSDFYTYSNSKNYYTVNTIKPGFGYWVKVNQSGVLILSSSGVIAPSARIRIIASTELPPTPPEGELSSTPTGIPKVYALHQNYPNPFNPTTSIKYQLPADNYVTLKIYNVLGQVVATLVDGVQNAGYKSVEWNANNMASGVYFCRLQAGLFSDTRKLLLLR